MWLFPFTLKDSVVPHCPLLFRYLDLPGPMMGWWDPGGPPSTGDPAPGERSPAAGGLRQRLQRRARCERRVRRLGRGGPGEKGTNDRVGARPPRCPDERTVTASPALRSRAPRAGDVTTMLLRTAEAGRRRRPQSKISIGPWATLQVV